MNADRALFVTCLFYFLVRVWCYIRGVKSVAQICGDIWGVVVLINVVVTLLSD
jgi:hypothetical protein